VRGTARPAAFSLQSIHFVCRADTFLEEPWASPGPLNLSPKPDPKTTPVTGGSSARPEARRASKNPLPHASAMATDIGQAENDGRRGRGRVCFRPRRGVSPRAPSSFLGLLARWSGPTRAGETYEGPSPSEVSHECARISVQGK
jgi:hypothetical protein